MHKTLFVFFCLTAICCEAQEQAYYICKGNGADLLLVDMYTDSCVLNQAFVFEDSISTVEIKSPYCFPLRSLKFPDLEPKADTSLLTIGPFYSRSIDSIYVDGNWHIIEYKFADDHFIGGRPNQVDQQISVSDIGIIYSSSSFIGFHMAFMLCHSDSSKQRVLQAVYKHLQTNSSWPPYHAIVDLATRYTFDHCLSDLGKRWTGMQDHLRLVSYRIKNMDGMVHLRVVIKNTSDIRYALPQYYRIGPSRAIIEYDNQAVPVDLLETHDGVYFKQMDKPVYLSPGETVEFSHVFNELYGCGRCEKVTYSGFRIYATRTFFDWLLDERMHNGKSYTLYPGREIIESKNNL